MSVWLNGHRVGADSGAPIGALCAGRLSRGTFITVRFTAQGMLNPRHQRARFLRDARRAGLTGAEDAFAALEQRAPGHDSMGRLALGPEGVLIALAAARRPMWSSSAPPMQLAFEPVRELVQYKSIERQELDELTEMARRRGCDGAALGRGEHIVDGSFFNLVFWDGKAWSLDEAQPPGATVAFARDVLPSGPCAVPWKRAAGALALSSLLGAAPVAQIGDVRFPLAASVAAARVVVDRLRLSAGSAFRQRNA